MAYVPDRRGGGGKKKWPRENYFEGVGIPSIRFKNRSSKRKGITRHFSGEKIFICFICYTK